MTVKVKLVNGAFEVFKTDSYVISNTKDMHPDILDVKIFADGRLVAHKRRKFQKYYKKYVYKPLPLEQQQSALSNDAVVEEPKRAVKQRIKKTANAKSKTKKKE